LSGHTDLYCLDDCRFEQNVNILAIGFFDGVHLGHQKIIRYCIERAKRLGAKSVILTFDNPPINVLTKKLYKKLIIPFEKKIDIICRMGVDCIVSAKFDARFAEITPLEFCEEVLAKRLNVREIVVGEDFRFGKDASGDGAFLKGFFEPRGVKIHMISILKKRHAPVSSTAIRVCYKKGDIDCIRFLMGRYPETEGVVVTGNKKGRELGFPTANLEMDDRLIYPKDGVYFGKIKIEGYRDWKPSLINIGSRPTFKIERKNVEAFIMGFGEDIYSRKVKIRFIKRLRDERFFDTEQALKEQIEKDIEEGKNLLN
jgi:riboflavin kinase / FMN adenylyltransferase